MKTLGFKDKKQEKGFTLIELSVVLLIVSMVIGSALSAYYAHYKSKAYETTETTLKTIKENLLSYVSFNGHLPCPDVDGDGHEDRNGNSCSAAFGTVPYADLQMMRQFAKDAFGAPVKYAVTGSAVTSDPCVSADNGNSYFCSANLPAFSKNAQSGEIKICSTENGNVCDNGTPAETEGVVAVLISQNKNSVQKCTGIPGKERENCDGDNFFFAGPVETSDTQNFFDDQVNIIAPLELKEAAMKTGNIADGGNDNAGGNNGAFDVASLQIQRLNSSDPGVLLYNGSLSKDKQGKNFVEQVEHSKSDQKVLIAGDVNTKLEGTSYQDYVEIDSNLNSTFSGKNSDDKLLILGNANDSINMSNGNDQVEIYGHFNRGKLDAGPGNDTLYIHGNINDQTMMGQGDDIVRVDGIINRKLDGGPGSDTLYLNMTQNEFSVSPQKNYISGFENIVFLK